MRRLKAKEMNLCRVICLDPPSLGRFAGRSDRPNSAALRHNFSEKKQTKSKTKPIMIHNNKYFSFSCVSSSYYRGHAVLSLPTYRVT